MQWRLETPKPVAQVNCAMSTSMTTSMRILSLKRSMLAMAAIAASRSVGGGGEGMQLVAGLQALNQLIVVDCGKAAGVDDAPG